MRDHDSTPETACAISRDTIHDLLAHQRRRSVIACLTDHQSLTLPDLADAVAREEHGTPVTEIPEDDILHVYLTLWHIHIPKLAEADVVTYNQERDVVTRTENADLVEQFLSLDGSEDTS